MINIPNLSCNFTEDFFRKKLILTTKNFECKVSTRLLAERVIRNNNNNLPEISELMEIMSEESKRTTHHSKIPTNLGLIDFLPLTRLLDFLEIHYDQKIFEYQNYGLLNRYKNLQLLKSEIVTRIQEYNFEKQNKSILPHLQSVYEYLSQDDIHLIDQDKKSIFEIGFVFGSSTTMRIEKAIELYKKNKIQKIMISGYRPFYTKNIHSEAEILKKFAMDNGVNDKDIIIETKSITIPDNVKKSIDLFEKNNFYPSSILLITSPFNMRRAYTNWQKFCPINYSPKILRVGSRVSKMYNKDNWFKNEHGLNIVFNEYFKIRGEHLIDTYIHNI
jgi:uncharacterized SAM-binding protein YcdF (DUF218 family)